MEHKSLGVREEERAFLRVRQEIKNGEWIEEEERRGKTRPYPLPATHPTIAVAQSHEKFQCG